MSMSKDLGADAAAVETAGQEVSDAAPHVAPTPGPWRWEVNLKSKAIQLCGGRPRFDLTVMDFVRWGMGGAAPRLLRPMSGSSMMLMEHATRFADVVPGREHHSAWFQTLNHPDAHLIAAAPEMYEALKALLDSMVFTCDCGTREEFFDKARAALAKAEGR